MTSRWWVGSYGFRLHPFTTREAAEEFVGRNSRPSRPGGSMENASDQYEIYEELLADGEAR